MQTGVQFNGKPVYINVKEFSSKFRSKYEVFQFLTVECRFYLPSYDQTSIWWLTQLATGEKKAVRNDHVKVINVPFYENLTVEIITAEALKYPEIEPYWPHERDLPRINRSWLCNMIYSIIGPRFQGWVTEQVKDRNEKISVDRNMDLKLDPEVAKLFAISTSISTTKGSAVNLMKPNVQRRRSKAQIIADKLQEESRADEHRDMQVRMEYLERQLSETTEAAHQNAHASKCMKDLIDAGYIRENLDGSIDIAKAEENQPFDPMKMDNEN